MARLDLDRIRAAIDVIDPVFLDSPQYEAPALGDALGCSLVLKVETLNPVRSFKGRGTEVATASLVGDGFDEAVCASAGNLGQALAYSGARRGVAVTVYAAASANPYKIERMRALGATVHLGGADIELPRELARARAERHGAYLVEDSLDLATCEGAATIALELDDGRLELDVVLVALGGGALASGIGFVMHHLSPRTEVITVQPTGAPAMTLSWRSGAVVTTETADTIADGVAGRCPIPEVLDDLLEVIDDAVLVDDTTTTRAMGLLFDHAGLTVEPSAALGVAAVLADPARFQGRRVATVVCGSNVTADAFAAWALSGPSGGA